MRNILVSDAKFRCRNRLNFRLGWWRVLCGVLR